jgi:hypothetical protein
MDTYLQYFPVHGRPIEVIFTARRVYPATPTRVPSEGHLNLRPPIPCRELTRVTLTLTKTYKFGTTALTVSFILLDW